MGISDLMRRAHERDEAAAREAEKALDARLFAAGLHPREEGDFHRAKPVTLHGWDVLRALLEREGRLTPAEDESIRRGRESVLIGERVATVRSLSGMADDPYERWNAIVSLGLDSDPHYAEEREKARHSAEQRLVRERREAIRERVRAGESLPDPSWPDSEPIPPNFAMTGNGALIEWQAIRELGFQDDPHYAPCRKAAMDAMAEVSRRRGDLEKLLASYRPKPVPSTPEIQQPTAPEDFVATEISIPLAAFSNPGRALGVVRYHPEVGLVQGRVVEESRYNRGAGAYPGARGARVREFRPSVSLLLEEVNFRRCMGLVKQSVWRVAGDPPAVVGRDRQIASTYGLLSYPGHFDTRAEAECFLTGATESAFVRETLPVETERCGDSYRLRFFARPAPKG